MELFLNCLWVVIAVVIVGLWRMRWTREHRAERREPLREWTAVACALVLLFFAVSLTDDLHAEVMLSDDCFTSRRHSSCTHATPHSGKTVGTLAVAIAPDLPPMEASREIGRSVIFDPRCTSFILCNEPSGRAPPFFSL
ncbi:MAG TPA: hypothetical protein VEX69_08595 [Candidatus Limnocylindria bacterium]|nr:hypothetical protein [Candidatus Limnocylindria bacterium]